MRLSIRKPGRGRRQRGNAMIEFALSFTLLVPLFLGMVEFGHAFYVYNSLQNAVRAGARYASMRNYDSDSETPSQAFQTAVQNMVVYANPAGGQNPVAPQLTPEQVTVTMEFQSGVPNRVIVGVGEYKANSVVRLVEFNQKPHVIMPYSGRYAPP